LKTIAGVSVGQKERVVLVQIGERQILVGVAPGQVNMLYALEKGDEVSVSDDAPKSAFAEKFKQSLTRLEKK
ncbi:MAG TPA: flagellar biosynthesis protein FliO, partial [Candidatus Tenderia electrophaga]|nr:flagellar biosynthesis protein FliO [Candidatus Tenderia electrophaga]